MLKQTAQFKSRVLSERYIMRRIDILVHLQRQRTLYLPRDGFRCLELTIRSRFMESSLVCIIYGM